MSRLPAPSKLARPGGLIRPSMPPPSSRSNLAVESAVKKRPTPRGPTPNQANLHVQRSQDEVRSTASVQSAMSEVAHDFVVGNRVLVGGDRPGVIAFLGTTLFSKGEWAGIVLDEPLGKNNGVVQGVQYFQCEPNHGAFARPQKLVLEPPKQLPKQIVQPPANGHKFEVGDAVLVSGTKPGRIAFLGPTQFAKGEWAGVVMEKPEGKNDGSVMGVIYFQCPPQHGLFARLHNLTLIQPAAVATRPPPAMMNATLQDTTPVANAALLPSTESPATVVVQEKLKELQVGDRVLVGGAKMGLLKFVGKTDFAKGIWAGIELDEAIGKNDGAVAGKRYFQSPPQHGLFAPLPRVEKITAESPIPKQQPKPLPNSQQQQHAPLHNTVTTATPAAATVPAQQSPRGSIGISPASSMNRALRHTLSNSTVGSVTSESHAAHLIRQQELEARGVPLDEQVQRLTLLLSESEQRLTEMYTAKEKTENEREELHQQVGELTRKLEDLQFQMEEETVKKMDQLKADSAGSLAQMTELEERLSTVQQENDSLNELLHQSQASAGEEAIARIAELEQQLLDMQNESGQLNQKLLDGNELLSIEQNKVTQLNKDIDQLTSSSTELSHMIQQLQEQLMYNNEQLTSSEEARSELEQQLVSYENELDTVKIALQSEKENYQQQLGSRAQELDVVVQGLKGQVAQLNGQLSDRTKALEDTQAKNEEQEEELDTAKRERDTALGNITDLEARFTSEEEKVVELNSNVGQLKQKIQELLVSVQTEQERCRLSNEEKLKLEEQIRMLRSETGDSSQQLSFLDLQLAEKERELTEVRNTNSELMMECTKLRGEVSVEKDRCSQEIEKMKSNYWSQVKELNATIDDLKAQVDETKMKYDRHKTQSRQEKQATAAKHKAVVDKLTDDAEQLQSQLALLGSSLQQTQEELEKATAANRLLEAKSSTSIETTQELNEERSKVTAALEEKQKIKILLDQKSVELKKGILLNEELSNKFERLRQEMDSIVEERNKLATDYQTLSVDRESFMSNLSSENKNIVEQRDTALAERDQLHTTCATLKKNCVKMEKEKARLLEEKEKALSKVQEANMKYDSAQMQLADLNENMEKVQNDLYSIQEHREQERISMEQNLERSESHNLKLQRKLEKMGSETEYTLQESKTTLEALELTREINQKLEDQLRAASSDVEELEMKLASQEARSASVGASHSAELKAVQQRIEAAESSLVLKEAELNRAREKITELSELASGSNEYMNNSHEVALLEEEKLLLEERVKELTVSLEKALEQEKRRSIDIVEDSELNTSGVSSRLQSLQSQLLQVQVEKNEMSQKAKESDQQIEFLGTVIQDLQRKLEAAEVMAGLGPPPEAMEGYQLESDEEITFNKQPAPRLFCDICDMFDDHDTDDCPLQAQTSESPPPSMHCGSRHAERPYCENCEMFDDHWTEDCQYDVTY